LLGCWVAGLLGCWVAGLLGCWVAGLLGCWGRYAILVVMKSLLRER
jgi:hypothetical protein